MWHIWDLEFLQTSLVTTLWSLSDIIMFLTRSCSLLSSPHAHSTIQPGCRTWPWPVSTPIFSALAWDQVSLLPGFYMRQVQNVSVLKHTFETKCHHVLLSTHFTYLDQHIYYILGVCKSVIQWLYWYVILIYLTSTVLVFLVFSQLEWLAFFPQRSSIRRLGRQPTWLLAPWCGSTCSSLEWSSHF